MSIRRLSNNDEREQQRVKDKWTQQRNASRSPTSIASRKERRYRRGSYPWRSMVPHTPRVTSAASRRARLRLAAQPALECAFESLPYIPPYPASLSRPLSTA